MLKQIVSFIAKLKNMIGYFPVLILQVFCFYHAYKNGKDYKWYLLIFFIPVLGSILYLFFNLFNKSSFNNLTTSLENTFVPSAKIKKLKRNLAFANTITNRVNLADEYMHLGQEALAKSMYLDCVQGAHENDAAILIKLMNCEYQLGEFESVVNRGEQLEGNLLFEKSEFKVYYGYSLYKLGKEEKAIEVFREMDGNYSNYFQRYHFSRLLHLMGNKVKSQEKLDELLEEISKMDRLEKKFNATAIGMIKSAQRSGFTS